MVTRPFSRIALLVAAMLCPVCMAVAAPNDTQALHDALIDWLECVECDRGELRTVAGFAGRAVQSLDSVLRAGPSAATLVTVEQHAKARYAQIVAARLKAKLAPPTESESQFVQRNLADYSTRYRARAAIALGEIGGPTAFRSLCRVPSRESVVLREAVQGALKKLDRKCP